MSSSMQKSSLPKDLQPSPATFPVIYDLVWGIPNPNTLDTPGRLHQEGDYTETITISNPKPSTNGPLTCRADFKTTHWAITFNCIYKPEEDSFDSFKILKGTANGTLQSALPDLFTKCSPSGP